MDQQSFQNTKGKLNYLTRRKLVKSTEKKQSQIHAKTFSEQKQQISEKIQDRTTQKINILNTQTQANKSKEERQFVLNNYYIKNFKVHSVLPIQKSQQLTQLNQIFQKEKLQKKESLSVEFQRSKIEKLQRTNKSLERDSDDSQVKGVSDIQNLLRQSKNTNQNKASQKTYVDQQQKSNNELEIKPPITNLRKQLTRPLMKPKSALTIEKNYFIQTQKQSYQTLNITNNEVESSICSEQFIINYSMRSRQGVLISNPNKVNQDACICAPNLSTIPQIHMFSVCDGHGQNGHYVSNFIKQQLPIILASDPKLNDDVKNSFIRSIQIVANQVNKSTFDTQFSGSTLNSILIVEGTYIICANIGDSRAVLARQISDGKNFYMKSIPLSYDHKPNLIHERQRIFQSGGRVDTYYDPQGNPIGPFRVWVSNANYPGLAMSRSLGDQVAASVGVSCKPDIIEHLIEPQDKFIVLASDGVWEFITNQECIDIITPFYLQKNLEGACNELMKISYQQWTKEDDSVIDDISFVIIFFTEQESLNSTFQL